MASNVPFWGESDSNVRWCEEDYAVTPFIAEFWNTLSSLLIVVLGVAGVRSVARHPTVFGRRFLLPFTMILITGVGSALFHATNRYWAQLLDELPMLWGNFVFLWLIFESSQVEYRYPRMPVIFGICATAVTGVYLFLPEWYSLFLAVYSSLVVLLTLLSIKCVWWDQYKWNTSHLLDRHALRVCRYLFALSLVFYVSGAVMWVTENTLCPPFLANRKPIDPILVRSLNRIQLHAWWHVCAGLGTYMWVQYQIAVHAALAHGILPSIHGIGTACAPILSSITASTDSASSVVTPSVSSPSFVSRLIQSWKSFAWPHVRLSTSARHQSQHFVLLNKHT